jgi:hypothetical protein
MSRQDGASGIRVRAKVCASGTVALDISRHKKLMRDHRSLPLAVAVLRVATATYASYTVGRSLYRSHKALGPAQDTRQRSAERAKLTTAFGSLAALGLVFAITSGLDYLTLSYKVWASERGIQVPDSCVFCPLLLKGRSNMRQPVWSVRKPYSQDGWYKSSRIAPPTLAE